MTWRLEIQHRTWYEYDGDVDASYNRARLTPCSRGGQLLLDHRIFVTPSVPLFASTDYWGTRVHAFDVQEPHNRLEVNGYSLVETAPPRADPPSHRQISWQALAEDSVTDSYCEYLTPSSMTIADDAVAELASGFRELINPRDAVDAITQWITMNTTYQRGITNVRTPASDVLAAKVGVCQDFAHLSIALLRAAGIPARYVSGYLHPDPEAELGSRVAGESHAWIEAWLGSWSPFDPTNGDAVAQRHIRIGHGRDYLDVAPLVGIYHGAPSKALHVSVELVRHA